MNQSNYPKIRDLAVIGDRRTLAIVTKTGAVVWYCPGRFDCPSLLGSLLDAEKGGNWTIKAENTEFSQRRYLDESGVLETTLMTDEQGWQITDWMSLGEELPDGICRQFSAVPRPVSVTLNPAPDYGRHTPKLKATDEHTVVIDEQYYFYSSHALEIKGDSIETTIPKGETAWMALLEDNLPNITQADLDKWLQGTLKNWQDVAARTTYSGLYNKEVADSLRALRLLTFEGNGAILAAGTTALPEAIGKERNFDYRYVWLRDANMIVSALIRAGSDMLRDTFTVAT
jgi:GH15 family glucan-1,4-alpha-glucosidase